MKFRMITFSLVLTLTQSIFAINNISCPSISALSSTPLNTIKHTGAGWVGSTIINDQTNEWSLSVGGRIPANNQNDALKQLNELIPSLGLDSGPFEDTSDPTVVRWWCHYSTDDQIVQAIVITPPL